MLDFDSAEDIQNLTQDDPERSFFKKEHDLYDESMLKIVSITRRVPKWLHQKHHCEIKMLIEGKQFKVIFYQGENKEIIYVDTAYKHRIPINVSPTIIKDIYAVLPKVKEPFKEYNYEDLLRDDVPRI